MVNLKQAYQTMLNKIQIDIVYFLLPQSNYLLLNFREPDQEKYIL